MTLSRERARTENACVVQRSVPSHEGDPTRCAAPRSCCFHATLRSAVEAFAFGACLLRSPERRPLEPACRSSRAPPRPHSSCTCRSAQAARTARASTSSLLESSTRLQAVRLAPRSKGCSCQVPGQLRARHPRRTAAGVTLIWNARAVLCLIWILPWASANRRPARPRFACAARVRPAL